MNNEPISPTQVPAGVETASSKLSFGTRAPGADGGEGAPLSAPRTKVSQQTIVLMVVLSVSASAIFGMRTLGMKAGIAMGSDVVEYTPPEIDRNSTYDRILADLARIQNPLDVALGEFGKSPFMLQQTAIAAPVDPVAAGEDTAEQRAAADKQAKLEARRKELTDQLAAMKVQSIMGGKAPLVRISGEMYRVGDTVAEDFMITSIEDRTVTLKADGQKFTLTLDLLQTGTKTGPARIGKGSPSGKK
ncbi:MAG: hypothetical protein NTV94_13005 [Planctomycetota bacterium]|nr:hypothetical protein [Planctomycetota bacterium]